MTKPNLSRSTVISEAANQVLNVRDFSGSKKREKEVAIEELLDNGINPTVETLQEVMEEANGEWKQSQLASGVDRKYIA